MSMLVLPRVVIGLLALAGAAAITLALMLASPVRVPPPLASIHEGAKRIDAVEAPDLSRYPGPRRDLARLSALSGGKRSA